VVLIFIIFKNQNLSHSFWTKKYVQCSIISIFCSEKKHPLRFQHSICLLHIYFASFPLTRCQPPRPPPLPAAATTVIASPLTQDHRVGATNIDTKKLALLVDGAKRRRKFSSVALCSDWSGQDFFSEGIYSQSIKKCGRQRSDIVIFDDFRGFVFFLLPSIKVIWGQKSYVNLVVFICFWGGNVQTPKNLLLAPRFAYLSA